MDYLVQIEVKRSLAERTPPAPARVAIPAPGDLVYVHASERSENGQPSDFWQRTARCRSRPVVPSERSQIRAYLVPGTRGGWVGAGRDWFEPTSGLLAEANPSDSAPSPLSLPVRRLPASRYAPRRRQVRSLPLD